MGGERRGPALVEPPLGAFSIFFALVVTRGRFLASAGGSAFLFFELERPGSGDDGLEGGGLGWPGSNSFALTNVS